MDWFRHRHGLATDPKLAFAAKRCGVHRAFVVTLWSYLLERASACDERGTLRSFCRDEAAFALDMERNVIDRIMAELEVRGLIAGDTITNWDRHQFSGDSSSARVKRFRERQRASGETDDETLQPVSGNVPVTARTDQNRAEQKQSRKRSTRTRAGGDSDEFTRFWALYPKRVAKGQARSALASALKKTSVDVILAGLVRAIGCWESDGTDRKYIPNPSTWLKAESWADEAQGSVARRPCDWRCDPAQSHVPG